MELSSNDKDQLSKVEWEGSVLDAIDAGVTHDDFDNEELQQAWKNIEDLYAKMTPHLNTIEDALGEME